MRAWKITSQTAATNVVKQSPVWQYVIFGDIQTLNISKAEMNQNFCNVLIVLPQVERLRIADLLLCHMYVNTLLLSFRCVHHIGSKETQMAAGLMW
jgi:hypothetical protein